MRRVSIILNGSYLPETIPQGVVFCADGGYDLLRERGLEPDLLIGDNDSIRSKNVSGKVMRISFDSDKAMTDGELAVRRAAQEGFDEISLFGALGGRQDHVEGNLALLVIAADFGVKAVIYDKGMEIHYTEDEFCATIEKNLFVSLVPFGEDAHIIETRGLKYPLKDVLLGKRSTIGISNVSTENEIGVSVKRGGVFIFINK